MKRSFPRVVSRLAAARPAGGRAGLLESLRPRWDPGTALLRLLVLVLPLVATWSTVPIGATPSVWTVPATTLAALVWAMWPGSSVGTFALGFPVLWWATGPADGMTPWALVAAAALVGAHVAAHVAATGPPELAFDRAYALIWLRRGLLVVLAAPLVYVVAAATVGDEGPAWVWAAGLGAACALFAAAQWAVRDATRG